MEKYKYIILVRHGEPDNPKSIVYNLDEKMKPEETIHLTEYGKNQLRALGKVIKKSNFKVVRIIHSNQTRVVESVLALNEELQVKDIKSDARLKDVYAPGPYLEKITMEKWKKGNNAYDQELWGKYNHEKPQEVVKRIKDIFDKTAKNINTGETGILLSHGDPIAWFVNFLVSGKLPDPTVLWKVIYPVQGQGLIITLDEKNKYIQYDTFRDSELLEGKSY